MIELPKGLAERITADIISGRSVIGAAIKQAFEEGYVAGHADWSAVKQRQIEEALEERASFIKSLGFELDERWLLASIEAAVRTNAEKGDGYIELREAPGEASEDATVVYLEGRWPEDPDDLTPFLRHRYQVLEEMGQAAA